MTVLVVILLLLVVAALALLIRHLRHVTRIDEDYTPIPRPPRFGHAESSLHQDDSRYAGQHGRQHPPEPDQPPAP